MRRERRLACQQDRDRDGGCARKIHASVMASLSNDTDCIQQAYYLSACPHSRSRIICDRKNAVTKALPSEAEIRSIVDIKSSPLSLVHNSAKVKPRQLASIATINAFVRHTVWVFVLVFALLFFASPPDLHLFEEEEEREKDPFCFTPSKN